MYKSKKLPVFQGFERRGLSLLQYSIGKNAAVESGERGPFVALPRYPVHHSAFSPHFGKSPNVLLFPPAIWLPWNESFFAAFPCQEKRIPPLYELRMTMKNHDIAARKCGKCYRVFSKVEHLRRHERSREYLFIFDLFVRLFADNFGLERHGGTAFQM